MAPTQVGISTDWTELFGGFDATFALRGSGDLYVWGTGITGADSTLVKSPTRIGSASGWFGVADSQIPGGASDGVDAAQSGVTASGESSYLETIVEGPLILDFDWKVSSREGSNFLEFSINGVVQNSISGEIDWNEQQFFIPAGTQELRWSYRKTGDAGAFEDAGWLDQVVLTPFSELEIALTALNYTPGRYVLDVAGIAGSPNQLIGTEYIDVTVEAENQGTDLDSTEFTVADVEVRLSTDRVYGNADDILLGTVSQVEGTLEAGDLMRFIGPIQLGDSIPAGFYYLIAKVDANEKVDEFDESNNLVISENRDVEIARLPALRIVNEPGTTEIMDGVNFYLDPTDDAVDFAFDIDENLSYYTEAPMRLRFDIQNVGLGRIEGTTIWTTEINLRGIKREDITADFAEVAEAVDSSINLGSFTVQELMQGRSQLKPGGDVVEIDIDLALPSGARLNDIIDTPEYSVADYLWFVEVILDSENEVEQSEIISESPALVAPSGLPWWIVNIDELIVSDYALDILTYPNLVDDPAFSTDDDDGFFGIGFQFLGPNTATDWQIYYESIYAGSDFDIALEGNFLAYAFNRNPTDDDTQGGQIPDTYGITAFEGDNVMSVAFDIVTRDTDLVYTVEAADDENFTSPQVLVVIEPAFDMLTGPRSLTGDGGLIDEPNVTSVLDQGYSARITVKDTVALTGSNTRYIRVRVENSTALSLTTAILTITPSGIISEFEIIPVDPLWEPQGWVFYNWPYVYAASEGRWHYFDTSYTQSRVNLSNSQWGVLSGASGWHYYSWPYSYSMDQSAWHWYDNDTQWVVDLISGVWARLGALDDAANF